MEKWTDMIKGADKYDKMLKAKEVFNTIDDEKFEEVKTWLGGGDRAEWLKMFATRKSCWNFFFECAKGNFNGARERIRILNKVMDMPTYVEVPHNQRTLY